MLTSQHKPDKKRVSWLSAGLPVYGQYSSCNSDNGREPRQTQTSCVGAVVLPYCVRDGRRKVKEIGVREKLSDGLVTVVKKLN